MSNRGYVFVLTPIDVVCPEGAEIAPNHRLVRAKEEQIEKIKQLLNQFNTNPFFSLTPYENSIRAIPGDQPGNIKYPHSILTRENWRYWIIEFEGTNSELQELGFACSLIPNDIELGFFVTFHESPKAAGTGWDPAALSSFFNHGFEWMLAKSVGQKDVDQIRRNFDDIKRLPPAFPHIRRALLRFDQLRWLPRRSEMVVIGLFSVIESLVSHAPKLTDSADSLSHQLRTKLPLLRKRFVEPVEHGIKFPGIDEESLWKKLYAYRSKIVHGEDSQLSGDLVALGSIELIIFFLREISKQLLQLSLREPQFMTDLKRC